MNIRRISPSNATMRNSTTRSIWAAFIVSLAFFACGGDDDDTTGTTGAGATSGSGGSNAGGSNQGGSGGSNSGGSNTGGSSNGGMSNGGSAGVGGNNEGATGGISNGGSATGGVQTGGTNPGGSGGIGGTTGDGCPGTICADTMVYLAQVGDSLGCPVADLEAATAKCNAICDQFAACENEYVAVIACANQQPESGFECVDGADVPQLLDSSCVTEKDAMSACVAPLRGTDSYTDLSRLGK